MAISPRWLPSLLVLLAGVALTCGIWLSEGSHLAGVPWPWQETVPTPAVTNAVLLGLAGLGYALCRPWRSDGRPILPLQAKTLIFFFWLALNLIWLIGGIRERDFANKPGWLKQTRVPSRAQHFSEPVLRMLRVVYNVGMACAWPLLANLFVVLLPVDRTLFLLACLGAGHEEGLLAHTLCGTAVWVWASAHAILTQTPMLAAGLWRLIVLPPLDGSETKATSNFMGLLAFLGMTALGVSSLARLRRLFFNRFLLLHLVLAPTVLLFGCLHDSKVFWYSLLGAVLYGADLVQRWVLRRRTAVATATIYPAGLQSAAKPASPGGSNFVVLRVETGCSPGCVAGQHVFIKVPAVSRWEWHPYSVAAHDGHSFAVVVKAGGDWERRLCRAVELAAAATAPGSRSVKLDVVYEGLYGTKDLQAASAAADRVLLFAGGAGITPVASVLQSLLSAAPPPLPPPPSVHGALNSNGCSIDPAAAANGSSAFHGSGGGLAEHLASSAPTTCQALCPPKLGAAGGGVGAVAGPEYGVWAAAGDAATAAADALAVAVGSGARVHLVWAVTQLSDAEALMPLLRAAAARGWRVDLHCTRSGPSSSSRASSSAQTAGYLCGSDPAASSSPSAARYRTGASPGSSRLAGADAASEGRAGGGAGKAPPPPRAPWQLHGAACWAVAALAALVGAVGANLGGGAASTYSCNVAGPSDAAGGSSTSDWVSSVRSAFLAVSKSGGAVQLHPLDSDSPTVTPSRWARLLSILLQGSAAPSILNCPTALRPVTERVRAAAAAGVDAVVKRATPTSVSLRVCRSWGRTAPELCVKCDPFKAPKSELQSSWPCCQARVCFFATHLAPLACWVLGVLLGAALVCGVWRWWSVAAAAAGRGGGRRRPLLAARAGAAGWFGLAARFGRPDRKAAAGEVTAGLLPETGDASGGPVAADGAEAAERGRASAALAPGLESMIPDAPGWPYGQAAESAVDGGVHVHTGRPDVDACIRAAAAAGDASGCGRYGRDVYGVEVYGVVVCGPESLQAAVQASYEGRLRKGYPESWFRGFSFTT